MNVHGARTDDKLPCSLRVGQPCRDRVEDLRLPRGQFIRADRNLFGRRELGRLREQGGADVPQQIQRSSALQLLSPLPPDCQACLGESSSAFESLIRDKEKSGESARWPWGVENPQPPGKGERSLRAGSVPGDSPPGHAHPGPGGERCASPPGPGSPIS